MHKFNTVILWILTYISAELYSYIDHVIFLLYNYQWGDNYNMSIGKRIKECREKVGLTQEELAKLLGVSKGAIGNYESDASYPKIENMTKLFELLKTDANYLFQDDFINIGSEERSAKNIKEINLLMGYRKLDNISKEVVDKIIDIELKRST